METLIHLGGAVKALGNGRIKGLLIPFGSPERLDLDGEYFDAATDYGTDFPARANLYYHHGLDPQLGKSRLARAELKADEEGVWFEAQLDLAEKYHRKIYELAEKGLLGASSGSAFHVVEKDGSYIKAWPIAEASVTVTPANPETVGKTVPLKSLTVPAWDEPERPSLPEQTEQWLEAGLLLSAGYRRMKEAEIKIGRALSAARRSRLQAMCEQTKQVIAEMEGLLAETEPREAASEEESDPEMGAAEKRETDRLRTEFLRVTSRSQSLLGVQ